MGWLEAVFYNSKFYAVIFPEQIIRVLIAVVFGIGKILYNRLMIPFPAPHWYNYRYNMVANMGIMLIRIVSYVNS